MIYTAYFVIIPSPIECSYIKSYITYSMGGYIYAYKLSKIFGQTQCCPNRN